MITVLTFIDISAVNVGVPEDFSFYLVSLVNAGGGVGRLLTGVMVDRWGKILSSFYLDADHGADG
jgi:MFS family permease